MRPCHLIGILTNDAQLSNPELFHNKSYVNGEWIEAKSGKKFDIIGKFTSLQLLHRLPNLEQIPEMAEYGQQLQITAPKMSTMPSKLPMQLFKNIKF